MAHKEKSGLATAGMVLGIIGICLSLIPIINNIAFILALLGLVFGIIGIVQTKSGKKSGKGKAVAAVILAIATIGLVLISQKIFSDTLDNVTKNASTTGASDEPKSEASQTATKIEVKTLGDAFEANQVAAEKEWGGKLVEFSAVITNINDGRLSFSEGITSEEFSMTQISCNLKDQNQALNVQNDQTVTVQGVIGEQSLGVIDLSDCKVL
ncbi:hypothetical protein KC939_02525 [Candidatus Saccharibacteria bacterium]|nr:hypothetical protein [Candidatus Saccharibacteria bacterium]